MIGHMVIIRDGEIANEIRLLVMMTMEILEPIETKKPIETTIRMNQRMRQSWSF